VRWRTAPFTGPRRTTLTSGLARPAAPRATVCSARGFHERRMT
jgi:hypothetical protein